MFLNSYFLTGAVFCLGLIIGSFLTMASWRLPRKMPWTGRSKCVCGQDIKNIFLVPVLGWVLQQGRAACCGNKIPIRYPLIELTTGLIYAFIACRYGFTVEALLLLIFSAILILMIIIDLEHQLLLDSLNIALAANALLWIVAQNGNVMLNGLAGLFLAAVAYATALGVEKFMKKEALGGGDIKFMFVAGLWLGWALIPWFFILSGIAGIIFGVLWKSFLKQAVFPFGPALCTALFILVTGRDWFLMLL